MKRSEVISTFWRDVITPEMRQECTNRAMSHNDYPVGVRIAFCEYIDRLSKDGAISEDLARSSTRSCMIASNFHWRRFLRTCYTRWLTARLRLLRC